MEVGLRLVAECRSVIGAHSPKCRIFGIARCLCAAGRQFEVITRRNASARLRSPEASVTVLVASRCCEKPPQRALTPRGGAGASLDEQTWQRHRRAGRVRAGALAGDTRAVPGASCASQPALFLRTAADAASPAQPVAKGCRRAGRNVTTA